MGPLVNEANGSFARRRFRTAPRDDVQVDDIAIPDIPDWTRGDDDVADEQSTRRAIREQREKRRADAKRRVKARQQIVNRPNPGPIDNDVNGPGDNAESESESESSEGTDPETESESDDSESEQELEGEEEEEEEEEEEAEGEDEGLLPSASSTGLPASTGLPPAETQTALPETTSDAPEGTNTSNNSDNSSSGISDKAEMGLIITGALVGAAFLALGAWFLYRRIRRRRDEESSPPPSYSEGSNLEPSRRVRFLAHIPFLKSRFADRTWFTIDEPYFAAAPSEAAGDEKYRSMTGTDLLGYMPDASPVAKPERAAAGGVGTSAPPVPAIPRHVLNVNDDAYYNTFDSSGAQPPSSGRDQPPRSPSESTLSSGWGNGTYIPPTPLHPPGRGQQDRESIQPPVPAVRRDTMYTEASVASSVPRFRTVNSWVKQQRGRMDKKGTEAVPEQDYGLMMPDEEVPRRVDESTQNSVGSAR